jgi:hypothetical protein
MTKKNQIYFLLLLHAYFLLIGALPLLLFIPSTLDQQTSHKLMCWLVWLRKWQYDKLHFQILELQPRNYT